MRAAGPVGVRGGTGIFLRSEFDGVHDACDNLPAVDFVHPIYLDFNSTTPLSPSVREAMEPYWSEYFMLPAQGHRGCLAIADAVDQARERVAVMLDCEPFETVFTGGGTEANNLAVLGMARRWKSGHLLVSALEHDSIWYAAEQLRTEGWATETIPVDAHGVVDPLAVEARLRPETRLVCLQAANPVLGTLQPVREVADLCHPRGVLVHCDAVQLAGKLSLGVRELRADTVAISAHKMYGPKGVGALYVRRGLELIPSLYGEIREMGLRAGVENPSGWVGLGAAARLVTHAGKKMTESLAETRDHFRAQLTEQLGDEVRVLGDAMQRIPNTLLLELPKTACRVFRYVRELAVARPQAAQPADEMTRCLRAIGLDERRIGRCCRVSVGLTTSREQCERAASLMAEACEIA